MKPNLSQFSLQSVILMLTGISCILALGAVGGRNWFLFGALLFWSIVGLSFGYRWALYGEGYWPAGLLGRMLFVVAVVMLPIGVLLLAQVFGQGVGGGRTWWWPAER